MYLKELNITGFKSFVNKVSVTLDKRTTCFVGPNGSGKSNILDAIRFVLGEQRIKELRGSSMTDVIFGGTKTRKPLNVATVEIVFDNKDNFLKLPYNEVSIKRKLYRTGESAYYLNGESVRLKDITNLFIDSNISKNMINIISQGEITSVLSGTPLERRAIFEEATGILKYKVRKEEALKKLDKAKENHLRVKDILNELENQLEPLKRDYYDALEYKKLKEKLTNIEVGYLVVSIKSHQYSLNLKREEQNKLRDELLNLESLNNEYYFKMNKLKDEENLKKIAITDLNKEIINLKEEESSLYNEINLLEERRKNENKEENIYKYEEAINKELKLKADLESIIFSLNSLKEEEILKEEELKEKRNRYDEEEIKKENLNKELLNLKNSYHDNYYQKNNIEASFKSSNNFSLASQILNNHDLKTRGRLIDLIDIPSEYFIALEVGIGSYKNNIVVDNKEDAYQCINYLKEHKLGRNTFLPLDSIKGRYLNSDVLDYLRASSGYINTLSNLIVTDDLYQEIVSSLVGLVIIVDNYDNAKKIAEDLNYKFKIITLDGDVFNIGGSVTGGSIKLNNLPKKNLEQLEYLKLTLKSQEEEITNLEKELKEKDIIINNLKNNLFSGERDLAILKGNIKGKEKEKSDLEENLKALSFDKMSFSNIENKEIDEVKKEKEKAYYSLLTKENKLKIELKKSEEALNQKELELDNITYLIKEKNEKENNLKKKEHSLDLSIQQSNNLLDNYLLRLNEDYNLTYEKASTNFFLDISMEEAETLIKNLKEKIKDLGLVNLKSLEEYEKVNKRYEFLKKEEEDLENASFTLKSIIENLNQVMKKEFKEGFLEIRKEFQKVFGELFKGGSADIILEEDKDILEADILIKAVPKGKELASISLLSGGEKTLTAISLLFAIINYSGIPFCIFDEVEAALDDENVTRFGNYLKQCQDKCQFIIITHKKKTMSYAHNLYGITMEEEGISKLISLKLEEE